MFFYIECRRLWIYAPNGTRCIAFTQTFENITDVKQILYLRANQSAFTMPASSANLTDRIVWND